MKPWALQVVGTEVKLKPSQKTIFKIAVDKPEPGRLTESIYMYTFPRRQQLSHSHPLPR